MSSIRVLQDGALVIMVINGQRVEAMPHAVALRLGKALAGVAKQAEEWDNAARIAADQAVLLRAGAPFGFTREPRIAAEAMQKALYDRDLRRYLPNAAMPGIGSRETFGAPTIRRTPTQEAQP